MAVYWVKLYVYDETAASFIGACSFRLANSDYDASTIMAQTRATKGLPGYSTSAWTAQEIAFLAEYYGAGYQQLLVPDSVTAGASHYPTASDVYAALLTVIPALSSAYCPGITLGQAYRLCVDPEDPEDNYIRVGNSTNSPQGLAASSYRINGTSRTFPSNQVFQMGFSWQAFPPSGDNGAKACLMCLSSDDQLCSVNVWVSGGNRNLTFSAIGDPYATDLINILKMGESGRPSTDPYTPGGTSGGGGGTGTFDNTSVPVDFPPLPTLSATDAGFITLFNPTKPQLVALADYMWNNPLFDLDTWKKIVADPMDAILGLAIVPVAITPGTSKPLKIGNISTTVAMTEAARQFEEVDCGTLMVEEAWGAYLDFDPYTKAEIYLPYVGTHAVSADDIMGKPVHIKYHVDILTGACCAYIKCGDSILYTFSGQCSTSVPIAAKDLTNVVNGVLGAAKAVGSMVASGGASAPSQVPGLVSTAINALKPHIEKSGSLAGTSGMLAIQTPYLILTRPRQALPKDQNTFIGYPSFVTATLGDLIGYTEIESIHPENIPATKAEISEIETLLGNGVIF